MNEQNKSSLKKLFENDRLRRLIIIAGALGIALIFLSGFINFGENNSGDEFSVSQYSEKLRADLERQLSKIEGAGKCEVLLTMENSVEYRYLENTTSKTKAVEPKIRGVLVLCEGGDNAVVREKLSEAVGKSLDISTAKICIEKLSEKGR